jgi:hypothetical protein
VRSAAKVGAALLFQSKALAGKVLCQIACKSSSTLDLSLQTNKGLRKLMKKSLCILAISACVFACGKQQARDKSRAETEREAELSAHERALIEAKQNAISHLKSVSAQRAQQDPTKEQQAAEQIENTPTPATTATTPSPVESVTPQPEASVTPTETPILSSTAAPTPTISSTPEATAQTSEAMPVASSTPRLRLNPLSTGTPFPQATVSAEFSSSPVASPVPAETGLQAEKPAPSTPATNSWIRNASGKKRAKPSAAPSSSP